MYIFIYSFFLKKTQAQKHQYNRFYHFASSHSTTCPLNEKKMTGKRIPTRSYTSIVLNHKNHHIDNRFRVQIQHKNIFHCFTDLHRQVYLLFRRVALPHQTNKKMNTGTKKHTNIKGAYQDSDFQRKRNLNMQGTDTYRDHGRTVHTSKWSNANRTFQTASKCVRSTTWRRTWSITISPIPTHISTPTRTHHFNENQNESKTKASEKEKEKEKEKERNLYTFNIMIRIERKRKRDHQGANHRFQSILVSQSSV